LGVKKIMAQAELGLKINIDKDGANSGALSCLLTDFVLERNPGASCYEYEEEAWAALAAVKEVSVEGAYQLDAEGRLSLNLSSNLDKILDGVIKALVNEALVEVRQRVREELKKLLAGPLKDYEGFVGEYLKLNELFKGDQNNLKELEKLLEKKKTELSNAAKTIGGAALGELDKLKNQFGF